MTVVLIAGSGAPASATVPFVGGYGVLSLVTAPTPCVLQGMHCYQITFKNNLNVSILPVIVYFVVHNTSGQTVLMTAASITMSASATSSAFPVIFGLPSGTYNATFFPTSPDGIGISAPGSVVFTI
jgi:hypothetical protein